jgi:DNA-binding winged helix-turn-helix (wHTH) protein
LFSAPFTENGKACIKETVENAIREWSIFGQFLVNKQLLPSYSSLAMAGSHLQLDATTNCVRFGRERNRLKPQTFAVLHYLVEHPGQVVSKEALLAALWPGVTVSVGVLKTAIWEIRHALHDPPQTPWCIETVPRRGYRFIAAVPSSKCQVQSAKSKLTPSLQPPIPNFVGREAELALLHGWLEKALQGERQIVLVTGEPGIGKTTLVEAFLQQIALRHDLEGFTCYQGPDWL